MKMRQRKHNFVHSRVQKRRVALLDKVLHRYKRQIQWLAENGSL